MPLASNDAKYTGKKSVVWNEWRYERHYLSDQAQLPKAILGFAFGGLSLYLADQELLPHDSKTLSPLRLLGFALRI